MAPNSPAEIQNVIEKHLVVVDLRVSGRFIESRGYDGYSQNLRETNLIAGALSGPKMMSIPPYIFIDRNGGSVIAIFHLGTHVSGYIGLVHGGLLATILDEGLSRCCSTSLPGQVAVTASLEIEFLNPMPTDSFGVLRVWTKSVVDRKAWAEGHIETLSADGTGTPIIIAKARGLCVAPKRNLTSIL